MLDFLARVLPSSGIYAAFEATTKQHYFTASLQELEAAMLAADAAGRNTYFSVCSLTGPNRLTEAVAAKRCLYLDIDFKDIPLSELPESATAVDCNAFIRSRLNTLRVSANLPPPSYVVLSGGGVHIYWCFNQDVSLDVWKPMARALQDACKKVALPVDHKTVVNAVQLLRMPGTHNHKDAPPSLVRVALDTKSEYPLTAFAGLQAPVAVLPPTVAVAPDAGVAMPAWQAAVANAPPAPPRPYRVLWIAESNRCQLVNWARTPANQTREHMTEGLWSDLLAMCSKAEDGHQWAHEFSRYDTERYQDGGAVDAKLAAWRGEQHPRTCATLSRHGRCGDCPRQNEVGASPIQLGYQPPVDLEAIGSVLRAFIAQRFPNMSEVELARYAPPDHLPKGYALDLDGFRTIYREMLDEKGEPVPPGKETGSEKAVIRTLWTGILWIQRRIRDDDGRYHYEVIFWPRRDEPPSREIINGEDFADNKIVATLRSRGFPTTPLQKMRVLGFVASYLRIANQHFEKAEMHESLGWVGNRWGKFNTGNMIIEKTPQGVVTTAAVTSPHFDTIGFDATARGDAQVWTQAMQAYTGSGQEIHRYALMAAFGSVLMPFTPNSTSHLIHLYSGASGSGKSSLQEAICSVWGSPRNLRTSSTTYLALLDAFSVMGNVPGTVDEITNFPSEVIARLAFDIALGKPRMRLDDQGRQIPQGAPWCQLAVTSANRSIVADLNRMGNRDGETARITSLRMPAGVLDANKQRMFRLIMTNHGHAGPAFVRFLLEQCTPDGIARMLEAEVDRMGSLCRGDPALRSALRFRFDAAAAIIVATALARQANIVPFTAEEMRNTAHHLLRALVAETGTRLERLEKDIRQLLSRSKAPLPRLERGPDGSLRLVRMANPLTGTVSDHVNMEQRIEPAFLVVNEPAATAAGATAVPLAALFFGLDHLNQNFEKLFLSIRADPVEELKELLTPNAGYHTSEVMELVNGVYDRYLRVLLPASVAAPQGAVNQPQSVGPGATVHALRGR